ncbi:TetR/AcrR family transcriptional regulator [Methyloferula stellata]|uniref:TetR/AcrR family transcriptional regulator n=1 Tax=Methyloferula stellata TaxID=876270 RepID=UPI00058F27E0|nr:TetR/AcrR family transcriptional regulator [Methyloferula stellata]
MDGQPQGVSRRVEYAEATRQAIICAARKLFSEQGYFSTKVDDIATLARVAPATVYAVSGGKQGLLRTLIETKMEDPMVENAIRTVMTMDDPEAIVTFTTKVCRIMRENYEDIIRVMITTAPHDQGAASTLAMATKDCRQSFVPVAERLFNLGALQDGMDVNHAVDVFWFYLGYSGLFTLRDDNGWSYERAEQWLCEQTSRALLRTAP